MGNLLSTYIFPHPPIIIPEIGRGEERKISSTIDGCEQAAKDIKAKNPDTIILITPHGPSFKDAVAISVEQHLDGSFVNFGRPDVHLEFENNVQLVESILQKSRESGILIAELGQELSGRFGIRNELDHGAMVPLYFIAKELSKFKLVHVCMGFLSFEELFAFGTVIAKAIEDSIENVVIVASGDLSHRLTVDAPGGYNKRGKEFDELLVSLLGEGKFDEILKIEEDLIECAGECGLRPFIIMFGALDNYVVKPQVDSYEGPFGVGYCVAEFGICGRKVGE